MATIEPSIGCTCSKMHLKLLYEYESPPQGETKFLIDGQRYRRKYLQCKICEHAYASHAIHVEGLYDGSYVDSTYGGEDGLIRQFKRIQALPPDKSDNVGRVRRIVDYLSKTGRASSKKLLDVGAGLGVFPSAMKAEGWDVVGIETDSRTVRHLNMNVGIPTLSQDLLDISEKEVGRFSLISFNKVLEHIKEPSRLLAKTKDLIEGDGVVYVEVPDIEACKSGQEREEFFIEHHHVFSPTSLAILAKSSLLSVLQLERIREPSGKYTLAAFMVPDVKGA